MYGLRSKVWYDSMRSGRVLGVVVKEPRYVPLLGDAVDIKVTSRTNSHYPFGHVFTLRVDCPWLGER